MLRPRLTPYAAGVGRPRRPGSSWSPAALVFAGATRRIARRLPIPGRAQRVTDATFLLLRRLGLPLLGLAFFLLWASSTWRSGGRTRTRRSRPRRRTRASPTSSTPRSRPRSSRRRATSSPTRAAPAAATMIEMLTAFALRHRVRVELRRLLRRPARPGPARRARSPSTSARSLSPRPERQTRTRSASSLGRPGQRVGRLERRDDALRPGEAPERGERLGVGRADVLRAPGVAQERVLGPDPGVVEARPRSSARRGSARPRRRGRTSARRAGRRGARVPSDAAPAASTPTSRTSGVVDEAGEDPDRVRAAADAGDDDPGQSPLGLEHLRPRLAADHAPAGRARSPGTGAGRRTTRSGSASSRRS